MRGFQRIFHFVAVMAGIPLFAFAGAGITYQGRLMKPDGTPVTASAVQFHIQVRSPGNENCLMYDETYTRDLSAADGLFAITLNDGTATATNQEPFTIDRVFQNRGAFSFSGGKCTVGSSFVPSVSDGRKLVVEFNDGSFAGWEPLAAQAITFVPMALESMTVGGYGSGAMLRVNDGTGAPASISALTQTQYTNFLDLLAGTSALYLTSASSLSGASVTGNIAGNAAGFTGSLAGDVTGTQGATSVVRLRGRDIDATAPTNGQVLKWNQTSSRWEPTNESGGGGTVTGVTASAPLASSGGTAPNLTITQATTSTNGYLSSADWNTFNGKQSALGYTPVNKAGDTMTGALNLPTNGLTIGTNQLAVSGGFVGVGTANPADALDVAGKIRATHLCASDGTNCKDLTTSWGSGGTVTSVTGGTGLTGTVTTTGSISLANIANNNLLANTSGSAAAPVATTLSGLIDSALTGSAQGNILYRGASGWSVLAPGTNGYFLKTQGAGADPVWAAAAGGSGTVTSVALTAPSIFSVSGSPVTTSGTLAVSLATQTANTVFAGPTTGSAAPAFRSLNIADIRSSVAGAFLTGSGCVAGETLTYSSVSDTMSCSSLSLNSSQVTTALGYTPVNKAGDSMSGALALPANGLTIGTNQLAVSGGFVGVGTASPAANLHVYGTSSTYFALQTSGADGNSAELILGGGGANADWSIVTNKSSVTGAADSLAIYKRSGSTGAKIVVRDDGNVGVGTMAPGDKLDVAGKIRATHLCASDGTNCKDLTTSWGAGGTVTSVTGGTGLTGTVTTTGSISLANIANNNLLANTSGSANAPVATSLSALIDSALTGSAQGNILYRGASGWSVLAPGTSGYFLKTQGAAADPTWAAGNSGTVTSVALTAPAIFSVSGSPVTTSGTLAVSLATQTANTVFAGPTTGSAAPTFRNLNIADLRSTVSGAFLTGSGCTAGQALTYNSVNDAMSCTSLALTSSQITTALGYTPVNKAGDTMTGALNLPSNGLAVGTSQLVVSGGNVGIGTTSPTTNLHIQGNGGGNQGIVVSDSGTPKLELRSSSATADPYLDFAFNSTSDVGAGTPDFSHRIQADGTTGSLFIGPVYKGGQDLVITSAGRVGIGSTSPGAALEVAGAGATSAIIVPRDTTANRPSTLVNGMIRYNTTTTGVEAYANGRWQTMTTKLMGRLTLAPVASCLWSTTSTSWATLNTATAACNTATVSGGASTPTAGKIPAIKFASLPAGNYEVIFNVSTMYSSSTNACHFRIWDGTSFSGVSYSANEDINRLTGFFSYAADQTNIEFYIQAVSDTAAKSCTVDLTDTASYMEIWVKGI